MIFKIVVGYNRKECYNNSHYGYSVNVKSNLTIQKPLTFCMDVLRACGFVITKKCNDGRNKRSDNKKMTKVTDEIMHLYFCLLNYDFNYELRISPRCLKTGVEFLFLIF